MLLLPVLSHYPGNWQKKKVHCSALKEAPLNKAFCHLQGGSLPVVSGVIFIHPNKWATGVITNPTHKGNTVDGKNPAPAGMYKPCK